MKEKCESLASLPAPLPSLASICLPLPLPLPATGVHTFKQGCMSFIQRAVYCVCLISTTTEILSKHELREKFSDFTEYWALRGDISNRCATIVTGHTVHQGALIFKMGRGAL